MIFSNSDYTLFALVKPCFVLRKRISKDSTLLARVATAASPPCKLQTDRKIFGKTAAAADFIQTTLTDEERRLAEQLHRLK